MRALTAALALSITLAWAPRAGAADVARCIEASERGQIVRKRHQLADARSAFIECAAEACPAMVRTACADWLREVEADQPSVVVAVEGDDGADVPSARVEIDGRARPLGVSVTLDPGRHVVRVRAPGFVDRELPVVAREGERNRSVRIELARTARSPGAPARVAPSPERPAPRGGVPAITWVTGGLALAGLASFAVFGITGRANAEELRDTCAPSCSESARDGVRARYVVADVSLLAAVVLGAVSVVTLVRSSSDAR